MTDRADTNRGVAVILGASTGTGAAIARAVAESPGLDVFGVHRGNHPGPAGELEAAVIAAGRRLTWRVADAGTWEEAQGAAAQLRETAGPRSVRLMVHSIANASMGRFVTGRPEELLHPKQLDKTLRCMAHSFVYWTRALYEAQLLAPGARLLGLTNLLHDSGMSNTGAVAASKAALEMYVRYLAAELAPEGYRVNLLKFGTVVTPALNVLLGPEALSEVEARHAVLNPAGRIQTTAEVGRFVSLLLRPEADWMTGATIDFTGGMTWSLLGHALEAPTSEHRDTTTPTTTAIPSEDMSHER